MSIYVLRQRIYLSPTNKCQGQFYAVEHCCYDLNTNVMRSSDVTLLSIIGRDSQ